MVLQGMHGTYILQALLGLGGMGVVYQAQALGEGLPSQVAIKALSPGLLKEPLGAELLRREAQCESQLQHPDIVQVFEYFEDQGQSYKVMELIEGELLKDRIQAMCLLPRPLSHIQIQEMKEIMIALCEVLSFVHDQGIVHGDVKASNIFVMPTGRIKLLDFGIAQAVSTHIRPQKDIEALQRLWSEWVYGFWKGRAGKYASVLAFKKALERGHKSQCSAVFKKISKLFSKSLSKRIKISCMLSQFFV